MWFEKLTGFREKNADLVRSNLTVAGELLISKVNGREYNPGILEIPSLEELRNRYVRSEPGGMLSISVIAGDVMALHKLPENAGVVFQAASQFNLLEMANPEFIPEDGVAIYEFDQTQGPACAIACGAGTIYRNYFVEVNGRIGQSIDNQIDCLAEIGAELQNEKNKYWMMCNGYAIVKNSESLARIKSILQGMTIEERDHLAGKLRIGIQWNTEVNISSNKQLVTQVYCSALPINYCGFESLYWKEFASLILDAAYEATFLATIENFKKTGNNRLFLTLVGGGAFGNDKRWIFGAIERAVNKFRNCPLDVRIVCYIEIDSEIAEFVENLRLSAK